MGKRAQQWTAVGPGVSKGFRGRELPFMLKPSKKGLEAEPHEFEVLVSKDGKPVTKGQVHEGDKGDIEGSWVGKDTGEYEIKILLDGEPINGSPFTCELMEPSDASKSYARGPGLEKARDDQPTYFDIFCLDKNNKPVPFEDALDIDMVYTDSDDKIKPKITNNKDGSYRVEYKAPHPGDLDINVMIAQRPIKDMPVQIRVQSGKELDKLMSQIDKLRKKLGLPKR